MLVDHPKIWKYLLKKSSMYGYNTIIQRCGRYQYYARQITDEYNARHLIIELRIVAQSLITKLAYTSSGVRL